MIFNKCFLKKRLNVSEINDLMVYTTKNATDLMQVVDFTGKLIFADLLQVDETTCIKPECSSQLAASRLTTCNRLVIIKPEQAMRTHPDNGLVIADLLQLARFWLCMIVVCSLLPTDHLNHQRVYSTLHLQKYYR